MIKAMVTARRALIVSATLASMSLMAPSSAQANGGGYDIRCDIRMRNYCTLNWEAEGYEYYDACLDDVLPSCYLP